MPDIGKEIRTIYVKTREEWRSWLEDNHDNTKVIWLLYYKKHTCRPRIPYNDAVEEAICYGWIDSIVKRIDEISYCQKFTPRRSGSQWSKTNLLRAEDMLTQNKMTPAGMMHYQRVLDNPELIVSSTNNKIEIELPEVLALGFKSYPSALEFFNSCATSYKNNCILWIESAKRDETRTKRIQELILKSNNKEKIGLK